MPIKGKITLPGDKSISHRMLMLASLTTGNNTLKNLSTGDDVESTRQCLYACGLDSSKNGSTIKIGGKKLMPSKSTLNCGNSGTTVRLMTGLLAGQKINAKFIGDNSLSNRPMNRIIKPLEMMGIKIKSTNGYLPIKIETDKLNGINYKTPIASAQVKSCILLAGLGANSSTSITEPAKTRDHTEIALKYLGMNITTNGLKTEIQPLSHTLENFEMTIPGDPSSASFFIAAALIVPGSDLIIKNILLNPTRTGFITILQKMGAQISKIHEWQECGESVGDIQVQYSPLNSISIDRTDIPAMIDELPIFALIASQADGITQVSGAEELRIKESDRIKAICVNMRNIGINLVELKDGFIIEGPSILKGNKINTFNDHRIAMTFAIANLISHENINLDNPGCIDISFPEFNETISKISL